MRQYMIVYDGRIEALEYPCVVSRRDLLIKPIYVYIGDIERNIVNGLLPVKIPLILGSMGVSRVLESREFENSYIGRLVTISPFGREGVLGLETDGILTNYASIDHSYIDEYVVEPKPIHAIRPLIKHAYEMTRHVMDPVLIEGCDLVGLATALISRELGVEPLLYCESGYRRAIALGFNVEKHISELGKRWGSIIITSMNTSSQYRVLKTQVYKRLIISRLAFMDVMPIMHTLRSFEVILVDRGEQPSHEILSRVENILSRHVKIIEINQLNESIGLFPPRGLGIILSLKI